MVSALVLFTGMLACGDFDEHQDVVERDQSATSNVSQSLRRCRANIKRSEAPTQMAEDRDHK